MLRESKPSVGRNVAIRFAIQVDVSYSACGVGILDLHVIWKKPCSYAFAELVIRNASYPREGIFHSLFHRECAFLIRQL